MTLTKEFMTHDEVLSLINKGYDMDRGWSNGKDQPLWHIKVFRMWRDMWKRCYDPTNTSYKNYINSIIHDDFRIFSNYLKWIMEQPRFEEFCSTCGEIRWSIDKDKGDNIHYLPQYMELTYHSYNVSKRNFSHDYKSQMRPIIGISIDDNSILIFNSINEAKNKNFTPSAITQVCKGNHIQHKGYKWFYLTLIEL